ncbi:glycosyltransferase family 4 protein [Patescibacteria group bacterium]|nr:glycosyltransferase family 4 protein [Patescibacteria group bacterium]
MKKIGWIKITSRKYGGVIYGERVREVLAEDFDIELINIDSKYFKHGYLRAPEILFDLIRLKGRKDLWIRDLYPVIALGLDQTEGKNMVMVYHIDFSLSPPFLKPINFLLEKIIRHNLKKADAIITISEYWKDHFLKGGYKNIYKIYPSFNLAEFNILEKEALDFKKEFKLEDKPIIYIGNCQKAKGVVESYQALKDLDVHLVTSGEPMVKIPVINLNSDYRNYLKLLKASSIVITMSKFKEGWCMTAHEAMLLKTPVIGSGLGGMRELLEGGKQIVCENLGSLKEKVKYLLNHPEVRKKMSEDGYNFAKEFTLEKFKEEWLKLIKKLI